MYYLFVSPAAKRQVVRRLRQGYSATLTLRWAMGLGQDPLQEVQSVETQRIEPAEYESQQIGVDSSSYIEFDSNEEEKNFHNHLWLWKSLYTFHENGWVKPTLSKGYKKFQYFVDIFWEVLDMVPLGTDMKRSYMIAVAICWEGNVSKEAVDLFVKYWEVLMGEHYIINDVVRSLGLCSLILNLSPEVKEVVIHSGYRWKSCFCIYKGWYDFNKEEYIHIYDVLNTLQNAFGVSLDYIIKGWKILTLWLVRAKEVPSDTVGVKSKFYPYSTDIISLATSKKQEEVMMGNKLMMGIELEFSHSSYSLKELFGLTQMGVFKYDSSVDGEYVTLPYAPEELLNKLNANRLAFNKLLSSNGSSKNGMHIHISKDVLTHEHVLNMQNILNPQDEEGMEYLEVMADRNIRHNQYCGFIPSSEYNPLELYTTSRYTVLNLKNIHTVEVRIFKSPSTVEGVIANIKFVMALIKVSKDSLSLTDLKEHLGNI